MTRASDTQQLSRLLFEAREAISLLITTLDTEPEQTSSWAVRLRNEIDTYRAEQGWSRAGYGGEAPRPVETVVVRREPTRQEVISAARDEAEYRRIRDSLP